MLKQKNVTDFDRGMNGLIFGYAKRNGGETGDLHSDI